MVLTVLGVLLLAVLTASVSLGQVPDGAPPEGSPTDQPPAGAGVPDPLDLDKHPKMEGVVAATAATALTSGDAAALDLARSRGLTVVGTDVRVVVESVDPDPTAARNAVLAAGGTVEGEYANLIQALLAPSALLQVANDPAVAYIRAPVQGYPAGR